MAEKKDDGTEKNPGADVKAAPGADYQDGRGASRYVGGGSQGGQNWANEGYGANQSYSAGDGYSSPPPHEGGKAPAEFAVSPKDLGVEDYDLQGGYGQPATKSDPKARPAK